YGVVNYAILLPKTHSDVMHSHSIVGYIDSVHTLRQQFRTQGIQSVSLLDYVAATNTNTNPITPWMPATDGISPKSYVSEFMHLMGHGISKGIQSLIRLLPLK
ncbi:MAG: hypothetical protein Q8Q56_01420, partial [Alphaproteobacteria bacterium]|nr:hypothetical protein [Alphaproteobacteria bacterium]